MIRQSKGQVYMTKQSPISDPLKCFARKGKMLSSSEVIARPRNTHLSNKFCSGHDAKLKRSSRFGRVETRGYMFPLHGPLHNAGRTVKRSVARVGSLMIILLFPG